MDTGGTDAARAGDATSERTSAFPAPTASPLLPASEARSPGRMVGHGRPGAGSSWYRSDQQRSRSVYRRANPWYRRLARGLIGLSVLTVVGVGLYLAAQAVQDYLDRDQLPSAGRAAAGFASTSFLVNSSAPAPEIDGTITFDTATGAFEFVGAAGGPQAGIEIVSPDGTRVYVRASGGGWRDAGAGDPAVDAVLLARPYLLGVDDADDILEHELRRGYVDLIDETTEGAEASALRRYAMELDTRTYSADHPLQWQAFEQAVLPGVGEAEAVPVTMWLDAANVVVRLSDEQTNWSWQRLTYSDQRFAPLDPSTAVAP